MIGISGVIFWLIVSVVLFLVESVGIQLICIWFSFGSLIAAVPAFLGFSLWVQLVVFLVSSVAFLLLARPHAKRWIDANRKPTNLDRVIGQTGVVIQKIDNVAQTGRILVDGLDWMARTEDDCVVEEDRKVQVLKIEGVTLMVTPVNPDR